MSKSGEEVGPKFVKLLDGSCVLRPYMFYQVLSGVIRCAPTSTATARRESKGGVKIEKREDIRHCAPI